MLFFQVFICCGEHQFDSVQLIYFTGTWIVVDGNDIGHRILVTQFFDDTFADYVVRQASKWLCAYDVVDTAVDQL